ncbi:WW domain binding protein 11-domain-containing protein [Calycina marina]|uniref:WW domain binding protein 11-domain-containing protein n=1 Tax=Calycina marina TaxID=1763456 RepID=A0A9P7Z621_9HELO|nr:WW domain binding protein 11-domain-containing protein [Calycina marina]
MPKEKSINPAQAQRKAEKAKAIKKGKSENQAKRNEKLAKRNPDRLQKQLDDLKAIESSGGKLTSHEKSTLEGLEKEIKAVKRAREALGDAAPKLGRGGDRGDGERRGDFGGGRGGRCGGILGKRRRDEEESSESDVPEDVKIIPMPRDTPPPIPKEILDKWYQARRERMGISRDNRSAGTSANSMPLGQNDRGLGREGQSNRPQGLPAPKAEARVVYESKPIVRDLRKEAVAFVPAAVRAKLDKVKGIGGLLEPEEADKLEKTGYMAHSGGNPGVTNPDVSSKKVMLEEVEDEDG